MAAPIPSSSSSRAPLASSSNNPNVPGSPRSKRPLRTAKSNPSLRQTARTLAAQAAAAELPPALPARKVFEKEVFVSNHTRDFPHLHRVHQRSSSEAPRAPASAAVRLRGPLARPAVLDLPPASTFTLSHSPTPSSSSSTASRPPTRRRVRQLSLVSLQSLGGLSQAPSREISRIFAENEVDEGDRRDSDDMRCVFSSSASGSRRTLLLTDSMTIQQL